MLREGPRTSSRVARIWQRGPCQPCTPTHKLQRCQPLKRTCAARWSTFRTYKDPYNISREFIRTCSTVVSRQRVVYAATSTVLAQPAVHTGSHQAAACSAHAARCGPRRKSVSVSVLAEMAARTGSSAGSGEVAGADFRERVAARGAAVAWAPLVSALGSAAAEAEEDARERPAARAAEVAAGGEGLGTKRMGASK